MSEFPVHTIDTAPDGSVPTLRALKGEIGFVPNLAATMAGSPTLLESFTTLRSLARGGTLSGVERESVALTVSYENSCTYCVAAHSMFAEMEGATAAICQPLRAGQPPQGSPRIEALTAFTRQVVRRRGFVEPEELTALEDAGFSRQQALEVLAVIAMTSLANWAHNLTGAPVDDAFSKHAWSAPAGQRAAS